MTLSDLAALRTAWHAADARAAHDAQAAADRAAIERRIVDAVVQAPGDTPARPRVSRRTGAAIAAFVLLVGAVGYGVTGSPQLLTAQPVARAADTPDAMVARLAERLKAKPDDAAGWAMLGRSYLVLEKPADAVEAYRRALALAPADADILADAADAIATAAQGRLDGEPMALVERALAAAPDHPKARVLAGSAAWRRGDTTAARTHWERAAASGEDGNPMVELARRSLAQALADPAAPVAR